MSWEILQADCIEAMRQMDEASVDAIVTDPPYGLEFMGKEWDRLSWDDGTATPKNEAWREQQRNAPRKDGGWASMQESRVPRFNAAGIPASRMQDWHQTWATEALRVLKPGGHLLAFGGTRTYHRLACAIEDAGFEIRDCLVWMYGSGFPKSLDVSKAIDKAAGAEREVVGERADFKAKKAAESRRGEDNARRFNEAHDPGRGGYTDPSQVGVLTAPATPEAAQWEGWGTALKPSHEPIVLARKPLASRGVNVRVVVENGLREQGIEGEIRWTTNPVSDAAGSSPPTSSTSTGRSEPSATSVSRADESTKRSVEQPIPNAPEPRIGNGESGTANTSASTTSGDETSSETKSSRPTETPALAAENESATSSPSTTSTEAEPPTAKQSTARSSRNSSAKDSPRVIESFAGIATGLTGSRAVVHISKLSDETFAWPDDLPERVAGGSTVAQNVLEHGTGALNIAATRITANGHLSTPSDKVYSAERLVRPRIARDDNTVYGKGLGAGTQEEPAGRWPANVALSHLPECVAVGTRKVKGHKGYPNGPQGNHNRGVIYGAAESSTTPRPGHADPDGTETITAYECAPGCPIAMLDEQSGAVKGAVSNGKRAGTGYHENFGEQEQEASYGDSGGAARFFYCAKSSRSERNAGLDGFEEGYLADANKWTDVDYRKGDGEVTARKRANVHPTVKPIDLMRWLVRLVTPPGGTCLDPFVGSGTTGCACVLEGFDFIGIEREPEYVEIAKARIAWWEQHKGREADEVLAESRRSEAIREVHESAGQLGLELG